MTSGDAVPREWRVPAELVGERLDSALARLAGDVSRRLARKLIEQGSVYLDGKRVRTQSKTVPEGGLIRLESGEVASRAPAGSVRVLWERSGILVLDKPPLVPLVPARESASGCLLYALARERGLPAAAVCPVHRLDTPTSGAVLVSLDGAGAAFLSAALRAGRVRKVYLAWVSGAPDPPQGTWEWPLSRGTGGLVRAEEGGRPALTRYRVLERRGGASLLELEPVTGRMHQLRVHCACAGHPILGDRKYGGSASAAPRALLHAFELRFPLPDGEEVTVRAPLPEDMEPAASSDRP
jgi:23S rRNA pseudouridine1911/1915/1917 synthase